MPESIAQHVSVIRLTHQPDFFLGGTKVRPSTLEVERKGERESLEPRVMQVLVALHRVQPEVVSRDDLIAQCWNGRTVGEDALNRVIGRLRRLCQADDGKSFTIETIPRVGYRLLPASVPPQGKPAPALTGDDIASKSWRALLALRNQSPDSLSEAMELYEQVVAASPHSADAWGGLALAYARIANNMAAASDAMRLRSLAAIQRAEALDPKNALTQEAKAWLLPLQGWLDAQRSFHEGLKSTSERLMPGMGYYLSGMGWVLETADRVTRAAGGTPPPVAETADKKPPARSE